MTETKLQNYIRRLTNALDSDTIQITHEVVLTEDATREIVDLLIAYEQLISMMP